MKLKVIISRYIWSFDFMCSVIITIGFLLIRYFSEDKEMHISIVGKLSDAGISIFSIIFPLFFATLSIIITSTNDGFLVFLQKKGYYTEIINTYKFTLLIIFIAFIYSIILHVFYDLILISLNEKMLDSITTLYIFILLYSLFSIFNSIIDTMNYALRRAVFLQKEQDNLR